MHALDGINLQSSLFVCDCHEVKEFSCPMYSRNNSGSQDCHYPFPLRPFYI